uniref:Uncharacterized protein n=1 Tax=Nelumbo nucifera TaxID=4432 RepID=A0A822Y586_NELNU|nr:TPA_asm: hypothetical protein HUJ06_027957 [Nelumbo nucifera]
MKNRFMKRKEKNHPVSEIMEIEEAKWKHYTMVETGWSFGPPYRILLLKHQIDE